MRRRRLLLIHQRDVRRRRWRGSHSQPAGQVPVALAQQGHGRGQQDRAHDRGVDQDRHAEADAGLFDGHLRERGEDGEHRHHDRCRARDDARGRSHALPDRVLVGQPAIVQLLDTAEDEDVVVHRQPEQEREQEERQPVRDRAGRGEVEDSLRPGMLEHQYQHAVRRRHRQQVEPDREQRHDQRAEGEQQQQERQRQHEADDQRQGVAQLGAGVHRQRRLSRHGHEAGSRAGECRRHDVMAQRVQRMNRDAVGAVADEPDAGDGDGVGGVDLHRERRPCLTARKSL